MRTTFRVLTALTLTLYLGCASASQPAGLSDTEMAEALGSAVSRKDRTRALDLVTMVLEDNLAHRYRFGYETLKIASSAVQELALAELAQLLRQVAALPWEPSSPSSTDARDERLRDFHDLLKFTAISDALLNLTLLKDSDAVALNLARIQTPLVRSGAVRNLRTLQAWNVTQKIREVSQEIAATESTILDIAAVAEFLAASPQAEVGDCALISRFKAAYSQCFNSTTGTLGTAGCENLATALGKLRARLACEAP